MPTLTGSREVVLAVAGGVLAGPSAVILASVGLTLAAQPSDLFT